jgi:hypothetical protein
MKKRVLLAYASLSLATVLQPSPATAQVARSAPPQTLAAVVVVTLGVFVRQNFKYQKGL